MSTYDPLIIFSVFLLPLIAILNISKLKKKHAEILSRQTAQDLELNKRFFIIARKVSYTIVSLSAAFFG